MNGWLIFALAFGPGTFWLWYFYKKDKWEPEPKAIILRMFLLGMVAVIPVYFIEIAADTVFTQISPVLLLWMGAPVIEELSKFLVVRTAIYNNKEFNEPMDGIVYAAAVALGFASMENLGYISAPYFSMLAKPAVEAAHGPIYAVATTRAVFSVPGHVLFSAMWGYALGASKHFHDPAHGRAYVLRGLILAMVLHAIFNSVLSSVLALLFLTVFMLVAWQMVRNRITKALKNSPFADDTPSIQQ